MANPGHFLFILVLFTARFNNKLKKRCAWNLKPGLGFEPRAARL